MLRETSTIVVARNERWEGFCATEPVECGWATEAIFFLRRLDARSPQNTHSSLPEVRVEISPDGMNWLPEGTTDRFPGDTDATTALRIRHFGNWLRLVSDVAAGDSCLALVTLHLK